MPEFTISEKVEVLRNFAYIGLSENFMRIHQDHPSGDLGYNPNGRVWAVYCGNNFESGSYATMWGKLGGKISFKIHKNKKPYSIYNVIWRKERYYEKPPKMTTYENIYHSNSFVEYYINSASARMSSSVNTNDNQSASVFNSPEQSDVNGTTILLAFCEFFPTTTDNLVKTAILSRLYI